MRWLPFLLMVACGPSPADSSAATGDPTGEAPSSGEAPTGDAPPTTASTGTGTGSTTGTSASSTGTTASSTGTTASSTGAEGSSTAVASTGAVDTTTSGTTTDTGAPGCGGEELLLYPSVKVESGLELCPDGTIHRHTEVSCEQPANAEPCGGGGVCQDGPCDQLGAGLCAKYAGPVCRCVYPCTTDADCADGAACLCASGYVGVSECRPADCRTDADCAGFECGLSLTVCDRPTGLFCRSKGDECKSDQDCTDPNGGDLCRFDLKAQIWRCEYSFRCP
jgi:hypothetical protein